MRIRIACLPVVLLVVSTAPAFARIDRLAEDLASQARRLADSAYRGFERRDRGNRSDVEAIYLAEQFAAGASLLERMVRDRRPDPELRDAVEVLREQARAADRYGFGRRDWDEMRRGLDSMIRDLGSSRFEPDRDRDRGREPADRITGRVRWRGSVDDEIHVVLQGSTSSVRVITGQAMREPNVTFTSALPRRDLSVQLLSTRGRGTIEVLQHPSRNNDYTAIVKIRDPKSGSADYDFELGW